MTFKYLLGVAVATSMAITQIAAQTPVKIGFVSTFSGPTAVIGNDMRDAFQLALEHLGGKLGDLPVEVIYEDDAQKPDIGKQKTDKLIESDKVNFLTGYIWSNVLLASLKSAVDSQTFLISANAGPSQVAGELCSPWFFTTSWQGDQVPQAVGEYLNQKGVKTAFLLAPNYAAGKDVISGLKANFKGKVIGETYTRWPDQLDFSAELSKARATKPDAIFAFYPGAAGVQFLTQYNQAGLADKIPLYTAFIVDAISIPRLKELAIGVPSAQHWVVDLPNDANRKFVSDFRKKFMRDPSSYASQSYDAALLLDSAIRKVGGILSDKNGLRDALRHADFESVRGRFKYGNNHFPIQTFYLQEAVKNGEAISLSSKGVILNEHRDRYHDKCKMTW